MANGISIIIIVIHKLMFLIRIKDNGHNSEEGRF